MRSRIYLLAGVVLLVQGLPGCDGSADQSRVGVTRGVISKTAQILVRFQEKHGRLPKSLSELETRPNDVSVENWPEGGYVTRMPKDGWGRALLYRRPGKDGRTFDLYSLGRDGKEGGEGADADIWKE